jgi:hypothetical protein
VRLKIDFAWLFKLIWAVQSWAEKYSTSVFQKYMVVSMHPARPRGAFRDRHERWRGMRWTMASSADE